MPEIIVPSSNRLRVLLVEPRYGYREALTWIPIGKGYLATQARTLGHEVAILDLALRYLDDGQLARAIQGFRPDVVGTGGMSLQWSDTRRIARIVRCGTPVSLRRKKLDGRSCMDKSCEKNSTGKSSAFAILSRISGTAGICPVSILEMVPCPTPIALASASCVYSLASRARITSSRRCEGMANLMCAGRSTSSSIRAPPQP